ncbi:MAG: SpaA isopeptide-forming pilin-related protein [Mycetocola sp.]
MRIHTPGVPLSVRSITVAFVASVMAIALALAGLVTAPAAQAATNGISLSATINGSDLTEGQTVRSGDTVGFRALYELDNITPGETITITLGDYFSGLTTPSLANNRAISDVTVTDGVMSITFREDIHELEEISGILDFSAKIVDLEKSEKATISWSIDDVATEISVDVLAPGDEKSNVQDGFNKSSNANLNSAVSVVDGVVTINRNVVDKPIKYTLNVDSATAREGFTVTDTFSAYVTVAEDSFTGTLTTWDENGLNRTTKDVDVAPTFTDNSFALTLDLPAQSKLSVSYTATIREDALEDIRAELQAAYDKVRANLDTTGDGGNYTVTIGNTAVFGDKGERTSNVTIGGSLASIPRPNAGQAFTKSAEWGTWTSFAVEPKDDGTLDPTFPVTYTLGANLAQWDDSNAFKTLASNVVISDTLPAQARWVAESIAITGGDYTLVEFDGTAADFAADSHVGQYAIVGQTILVNIGKDAATKVTVTAGAEITTLAGLDTEKYGDTSGIASKFRNIAHFTFTDGKGNKKDEWADHWTKLVTYTSTDNGVKEPGVFNKSIKSGTSFQIAPGTAATIPYEFSINRADTILDAIDVTKSRIIDPLDTRVFDVKASLASLKEKLSGTINGSALSASAFTVSQDEDGAVVIALSDEGKALVADAKAVTGRLVVVAPLVTNVFVGKQSLTVSNTATVVGEDDSERFWSERSIETNSFGVEAEANKTVWDHETQSWTKNLRAELDGDALANDVYVYNLAYVPHNGYNGVPVSPVKDVLPANTTFLGFVSADNVDSAANPQAGPISIGGNLQASYDEETRTVSVQTEANKRLNANGALNTYVAVRVDSFTKDVPIVNTFGRSSATVTPSNDYPISINKVDATDDTVVISDDAARFTITTDDEDATVIVRDAFVQDGFLRVKDADGTIKGVTVPKPGNYRVTEKVAPEGYALPTGDDAALSFTVNTDGTSEELVFPNTPAPVVEPTEEPTVEPTEEPTTEPTDGPTVAPSEEPTVAPSEEPTDEPSTSTTEPATASPDASATPTADADQDNLARTGAQTTGLLSVAGGLLLAAALVLGLRARRRS